MGIDAPTAVEGPPACPTIDGYGSSTFDPFLRSAHPSNQYILGHASGEVLRPSAISRSG